MCIRDREGAPNWARRPCRREGRRHRPQPLGRGRRLLLAGSGLGPAATEGRSTPGRDCLLYTSDAADDM
eukprot:3284646-Alexandrium_andersonii.AAC.1